MRLVLDASAAVGIALENGRSEEFLEQITRSSVVMAPDTYVSEVTNVFWKYKNFRKITDEVFLAGIEFCVSLVDVFISSKDLWREAYMEGVKNNSSTYDMFYLVVARRNSAKLLTRDEKLHQIAKEEKLT